MRPRRHPIVTCAIGFAIVPAVIELLNAVRAGVMLAGGSAGALRAFDSSFLQDTPWAALLRTRWPILMLVTGLAMLSRRPRWAVPVAWAYVIVAVVTVASRTVLSGWIADSINRPWDWPSSYTINRLSFLLSFVLTQAMEVLPALLLLIAAHALRGAAATADATAPLAAVADTRSNGAAPLLGYHTGRSTAGHSRGALRLAFAVACIANLRLICELILAGGLALGRAGWCPISTMPYYLLSDTPAMSIDAMSEYALRIGWALLLIGLWPSRRLVWSRNLVNAGTVAMAAWAGFELLAVLLSADGRFTIAGHMAQGVIPTLRIEIAEMATFVMILVLLRSPLSA